MENTNLHTDLHRYIAVLKSKFDLSQEPGCINMHSKIGNHLFEISSMGTGWIVIDYRDKEVPISCRSIKEAIETVYILTEIPE